jgi:aminoglycoside 6'-N-acetyltransferase
MTHPEQFQGERVLLRTPTAADADPLLAILSEPGVAVWWGAWDLTKVQNELITLVDDDETVVYLIEVEGEIAGIVQFYEELDPQYHHASIDIFLGEAWQGRGLGPEAIRLVIRYLFDERGHHRITIDPAADNRNAIAAYGRLGFKPVGVMRQYEQRLDGTFRDGLLMDLLRDEFASGSYWSKTDA